MERGCVVICQLQKGLSIKEVSRNNFLQANEN